MTDREILPDFFRPDSYVLKIDALDFKKWTYRGVVSIFGMNAKPTQQFVLNALELEIKSASVRLPREAEPAFKLSSVQYDAKKQRATLKLDKEIPVSDIYLVIEFEGILNNDMAGFYRSKYKPVVPAAASVPRDDEFHYMFSTQFESCDARRAFPCFDEPNIKAVFDFQIEVPTDQVALSNMPVKSVEPTRDGWHNVTFERTPKMSTYLLAWAVGDFEYVESHTEPKNGKPIPVRVYTTRGLKEQGRWALQHAPKTIDLFSERFGSRYPLPKADLLAVHEFTHGAMENWGLVTYRTTAVLFDEKTSDAASKRRVAYVVAHELAHQWFGNLVTMDWWDELWLNESFATWAGWYAVNEMHPEWQVWAQFLGDGMERAFKLDSIRASHPIHVPVRDALDVNQIFDAISYLKGASTLRMLVNHLGEKKFLEGVAIYLKNHAYRNAKTDALWASLSQVSGIDVASLMSNWVKQIGHPMLTLAEEPGQITIRQSRFLSTGDVRPEDDQTTWWVPLGLQGKKGSPGVQAIALGKREDTIRGMDDDFYKINHGGTGFYRTNYPPPRLAKLGTQLDRLSDEDKVSIIGSATALAASGYGTTPALLSFLRGFGDEKSQLVWSQALDSLGSIKGVFGEDADIKSGLEKLNLEIINDAVERVGWEFKEGEDFLTGLLRKRLLLNAASNGHPGVTQKALELFETWCQEKTSLNPNLRSVMYRAVTKTDPQKAFGPIKNEWATTTSVDGRDYCLSALGHIKDESMVVNEILPFLFNTSPPALASEVVPVADMHTLGSALSSSSVGRSLLWQYLKDNWGQATKKMTNPIVLDRFVRTTLGSFTEAKYLDEIEEFFKDKDTASFDRTLEQVKDSIRTRVAYRTRETEKLKEWLATQGYIS